MALEASIRIIYDRRKKASATVKVVSKSRCITIANVFASPQV